MHSYKTWFIPSKCSRNCAGNCTLLYLLYLQFVACYKQFQDCLLRQNLVQQTTKSCDRLYCWLMSACCRSCQQRIAVYQHVTKPVSTFLLMLFIISIYYSFVETIRRIHNNYVCQGLGKLRFYYFAQISYKKIVKTLRFFRLLLHSTAGAVKSGCLSNLYLLWSDIIFFMNFRGGLEKIQHSIIIYWLVSLEQLVY